MVGKRTLIHNIGINDANYIIMKHKKINGKRKIVWRCNFYSIWAHMIERCYSKRYHEKNPTYIDCSIDKNWFYFSNFRSWMVTKDYLDKQLDKDLLFPGNKVYSPETCVFISSKINTFILDCCLCRGKWPIGVNYLERTKKFIARCRNPFTGKKEHIGCFKDPNDAHIAWKARKYEYARKLASLENDTRIKNALLNRFLP